MTTHRPFRFGAVAADASSHAEWVAYARKVEALGYSTLVTGEHLSLAGAGSLGSIAALNAQASCKSGVSNPSENQL